MKKRKWDTKDLSRFAWEITDTRSPDEPQKPFDWWQHVEDLCASAPDANPPELTLQDEAPVKGVKK